MRIVKEAKIFKRNKVPLQDKVLSALMHYSGSSLRSIAKWRGFTYEAVRQWYHALRRVLKEPERKLRRTIAIDETKTKLHSEQVYVWMARDVDTREVLAVRVSYTRSALDAELFLKQVLQYCENKPLILVDHGPWYVDALKRLGLDYEQVARGKRNSIESW
ncbi:MAG: DDE-type integrase/transposase/recombinase, partial [Nitrososphaerales archaeon]